MAERFDEKWGQVIAIEEGRAIRARQKAEESPVFMGAIFTVPDCFLEEEDGPDLPNVKAVRDHYADFGYLEEGAQIQVLGISPTYGALCRYLGNVDINETGELAHRALFFLSQQQLEAWPGLLEEAQAEKQQMQEEVQRLLDAAHKKLGELLDKEK